MLIPQAPQPTVMAQMLAWHPRRVAAAELLLH